MSEVAARDFWTGVAAAAAKRTEVSISDMRPEYGRLAMRKEHESTVPVRYTQRQIVHGNSG